MNVDGLLNKALATSRIGSFASALAAVTEALAIEPESKRAHRVLATVLLRKGDPWEAETALLAAGPVVDAVGMQLHANILFRIGRCREAVDRSREAVRLAPDSAEAHHNLGRMIYAVGSESEETRPRKRSRLARECEAHWGEAVRLAPEYLPPRASLAQLAVDSGNLREARRLIDECVRLDPSFAESRLLAGRLSWRAGDWEAARHHAEWLLANEGSHQTALTLLNQTRLAGGPLIRPIQRIIYNLSGRRGWVYITMLLGVCGFVSCLPLLGIKPASYVHETNRLLTRLLICGIALTVFFIRSWPRWQARRALRAPDLSNDF